MKQCPRCETFLFEDMGICYKCLCEFENAGGADGGAGKDDAPVVRDSCVLDLGEWAVLATAHLVGDLTAMPSLSGPFAAVPLIAEEGGEGEAPVLRLSLEVRRKESGTAAYGPQPPWEPALSYPTMSS